MSINILNISISGDCSVTNSGAIEFLFTGNTPGWAIYEGPITSGLLPSSGYTSVDYTFYQTNGLPAGEYFLTIVDASLDDIIVPFYISSGTSISIDAEGTTCNLENGSITAATTSTYAESSFLLYTFTDDYVTSATTPFGITNVIFSNLSADTYYVIGDDGGGCTGKSASVIIKSSTTFDYGAYVVNDSSCISTEGQGKIFITGLTTPTSAYTIDWITNVNGQSGTTVTGLTQGLYTVKITNTKGCVVTKAFQLNKVPNVGVGAMLVTQPPSCFLGDGEVNVIVTGGTAPYFYYGSNGESHVDFATNYTFTGLSGGFFEVTITDAGLCTATRSISLVTPNSFDNVTVSTSNSNCNNNNGSISVNIGAGTPGVYNYTLSGSNGTLQVIPNGNLSQTFQNLSSGNYAISIDKGGCTYSGYTTITNVDKFTITALTINTQYGLNNGQLSVSLSTGATLPVSYKLTGPTPALTNVTQNSGYFQNLAPGNYILEVTDSGIIPCTQTKGIFIAPSSCVDFIYTIIDPILGNDGRIDVYITDGTPPFNLSWSPTITGQTGTTVTGLTSGLYDLTITDGGGCTKTKSILLKGTKLYSTYEIFTICEDNFEDTKSLTKRGILQMYNEGFYDLTSGDTNCIVTAATFTAQAIVGGEIKEDLFYSSSGITDYPTDYLWSQVITDLFNQFNGIGDIIIDFENNTIKLTNDCEEIQKNCGTQKYNLLNDENIKLNLIIDFNIACVACT